MRIVYGICVPALAWALAFFCPAASYAQTKAEVSSRLLWGSAQVVFTWDEREKVPFFMETHGDKLMLHFTAPVALKWKQALPAVQSYIERVDASPDHETVTITLRHPARAQYFTAYGRDGIDLGTNGIVLRKTRNGAPIATLAPAPLLHAPHRKTAHAKAQPVPVRGKITLAKDARRHASYKITAQNLAALAPSAGEASPARPAVATAAPMSAPVIPVTVPPPPPAKPQPVAETGREEIQIPLKTEDTLAVFVRNNTLWIVASPQAALSASKLQEANPSLERAFQPVANAAAAVLTLPMAGRHSATVERLPTGETHILLEKTATPPSLALTPLLRTESAGEIIAIPADKADALVTLHDTATGDELKVVPLPATGIGIADPYSFVQFNIVPSAQGVVIQKLADNLSVSLKKGLIRITSPQGLIISPEVAAQMQESEAESASGHGPHVLFPYAHWKLADEKNLVPAQVNLIHDIVYASADVAAKARLKLLGLYLSEGLFAEARGVAGDILRVSYKSYRDNKVSAARGAADFFAYRVREAERDFSAPELMRLPEAAMWRTLCRELLGEGKETFDFVGNYDNVIRYYPPVFIEKLAVMAADRSINRKDYDTATAIFDILKRDGLEEPVKKYVDYMRAKIFSETKDEEEAVRIWSKQAADVSDPLIRARAEFSLINLQLRQEKITPQDAEKRLERLRIVWRDDSLELGVLTLLGNLYIADQQYANALYTLRDIVLYFPDTPDAITTARKMEDIFVTLFNKGGADAMPPLQALSLFYEFRDLVPLGKPGDEMIRNLADRLVGIDLLDRAGMLLNHQVQKRLQGEDRSRIGTHLAQIYLMNHQPREALETLKTTGYGDLPPALQLERLRLTARALAEQGQTQKAIDVLSSDSSVEGSVQRLSIYWDKKDWTNVVSVAEEILANRNDPSAPLTLQESDVLLKLATAYVYEHDTGQIQYLRDYFTPLLKGNPNKSSFLFITSESGALDYETLSNLDQDITEVKSFLGANGDKVKKNGLTHTVN